MARIFCLVLVSVASIFSGSALAGVSAADTFISAVDAKALLGTPNVVFVHAGTAASFKAGHIRGSSHAFSHDMQYLDDVQSCGGMPMCEANAEAYIGALGIDNNTQVIAYEDGKGVNESGIWFFLLAYGHDNVQIMTGGTVDWAAAGFPLETGPASAPTPKSFDAKPDPSMVATLADVKAASGGNGTIILDARHDLKEYTGQTLKEGMKNAKEQITVTRGGHIPGAIFSPWSKYAGNKSAMAGKPVFKSVEALKKSIGRLAKRGYTPTSQVITYCHVGLGRGSFQYLGMKLAGHENVKLYMGSWSEYGNSDLPLETQ